MRLKEVLKKVLGIKKADLQYWETKGYIRPAFIAKERISRRDYGPAFEKIKLMWGYYKQGFPPEEASRKADLDLGRENELKPGLFFKLTKSLISESDIVGASITELGALHAPGAEPIKKNFFFASSTKYLAIAVEKMLPELVGLDFIVTCDNIGAILAGGFSVALTTTTASKPPVLIEKEELETALAEDVISSDSKGCLLFGLLDDMNGLKKILEVFEMSRKAIIAKIVNLACTLEEGDTHFLVENDVHIISLFDNKEIQGLYDRSGTE